MVQNVIHHLLPDKTTLIGYILRPRRHDLLFPRCEGRLYDLSHWRAIQRHVLGLNYSGILSAIIVTLILMSDNDIHPIKLQEILILF